MISYQVTSAVLGTIFAIVILWLVRRDHLRIRYSVWWIFVAGMAQLLGLFPHIIDRVAALLGVTYAPTLLIILGIAALLIKILTMDIEYSRQERSLRRLAQRIAIFEAELNDKKSP